MKCGILTRIISVKINFRLQMKLQFYRTAIARLYTLERISLKRPLLSIILHEEAI